MLLADCTCTSSIQSFNLFAICSLQWAKDSDVTGLELMGGVRQNTTKDNIVFKTILRDFERLVRPEAVINKNLWLLIRLWFSFRIKHVFDPVQADLGVGVPRLGARKMLYRSRVYSLCASLGCGWPDDQRKERSTVCRYAFDRIYHRPLNTRASIISRVVLTY
jgi:hypothetical protein